MPSHVVWCPDAAALSDGDYVHAAILHSDVCLLIGHDVVEKPPFFMGANSKKIVGAIVMGFAIVSPCLLPHKSACIVRLKFAPEAASNRSLLQFTSTTRAHRLTRSVEVHPVQFIHVFDHQFASKFQWGES